MGGAIGGRPGMGIGGGGNPIKQLHQIQLKSAMFNTNIYSIQVGDKRYTTTEQWKSASLRLKRLESRFHPHLKQHCKGRCRQRGQMGWSAGDGGRDCQFKPHQVHIVFPGKATEGTFLCRLALIEMQCVGNTDNSEASLSTKIFQRNQQTIIS